MRVARLLIVSLSLVLFAGCNGSDKPPAPTRSAAAELQEAVRLTLAEGTARLQGVMTNERGEYTVEGVVSLVDPRANVVAGSSAAPGVELRVDDEHHAWIRTPSHDWTEIDPSAAAGASTGGWQAFFLHVDKATGIGHRRGGYRAVVAGEPATIDIDGRGRITRLRLRQNGSALDFSFRDFGVPLAVTAP